MAHFAQISPDDLVLDVLVIDNTSIDNLPFPESEPVGQAYLAGLFPGEVFLQTSYNGNFRYRYAGIGYTYMAEYDAFVAPPAYPDFIFDATTCAWIPPIPYPTDGGEYYWDDATHQWILVVVPHTVIG
jgi:hypothetical protein